MRIDLNSEIWGNHAWFFIDSILLSYPSNPSIEEKNNYKNFFYSLKYILPCLKCRNHYKEYLKKNPLNDNIMDSKNNILLWIVNLHNKINNFNNKKEISLNKLYKYYSLIYKTDISTDSCYTKCSNNNDNEISIIKLRLIIILFGIIVIFLLFIIRKYQLKILSS